MKKALLFVIISTFCAVATFAQPSQAFIDAAKKATASYNKVNLKCVEYAKALNTFLKANATTYGIKSYKHYQVFTSTANVNIGHDDYPAAAISTNGKHIFTVIDGYVFDNLHPDGQLKATWESRLFSVSGGGKPYPSGFKTPPTDVTTTIQTIQ